MSEYEKKRFEAACDVSWPDDKTDDCPRDLSECPYGWYAVENSQNAQKECVALPQTEGSCSRVQPALRNLPPASTSA
jgi:hypothetical protein